MITSLVLLTGVTVAAGLVCLVIVLVPSAPRLDAALNRVAGDAVLSERVRDLGNVSTRSDRLGAFVYRFSPFPLSEKRRRVLRLHDKSIAEFYADKAVMAIIGAVLPALAAFVIASFTGQLGALPAVASLAGALLGFFIPDLLIGRATSVIRSGAVDALLVYIDLVTLERLTNASATQALQNAAALSEVPLFVQIRTALERARLEQQSPYAELRRLANQLKLPELHDLADVMQLDETGAVLSGALRARVRELRDAHMTQQQIKASAAAEGMTLYMTIPAMVFGLIFLVAALLKIVLN